jgi:DDE family transposase
MSTYSRTEPRRSPAGFLGTWAQLVGPRGVPELARRRGRTPRVPLTQLLPALTWHVMQDTGTLAEHLFQLFREPLADSSWSDRRLRLPWEIFAELMRRALRPRATARQHRDAFWRGWRLVALDGTHFSLINTPQITDTFTKAATRRGRAAFAKMTTAVLLEVGLHNPLAAAIGRRGESEWALAQRLLAQLPKQALLLGDRLYGVIAFARLAAAACRRVGSQFLLRASRSVKPRLIKRLRDGTRLVGLPVRAPDHPARIVEWLEVREIRVRVGRPGHRPHELRLWTSLLDPQTAPALELARAYASRWEHELYFREIKRQLRRSAVLQSHTVETGAQEIAAIVLASAVIASERARAATEQIPALRVSFGQILHVVRGLWLFFGPFDDVFTDPQKMRVIRRGRALIRRCVIAPRRARTCPRAVRQPVTRWPRLMQPQSIEAPWQLQIV